MALSCIVCKIYDLFFQKSRNSYTPPVFSSSAWGDPIGISRRCLILVKIKWLGTVWWRNYDNILSRFHRTATDRRQTDDGRTELLYQYFVSVCWRAIKTWVILHNITYKSYTVQIKKSKLSVGIERSSQSWTDTTESHTAAPGTDMFNRRLFRLHMF